jgi:glycosyltransferase involved in cell wall biosynthesis
MMVPTQHTEIQVSLLLPTYNRAAKVLRLLQNIDEQLGRSSFKGSVEVLVSDNASTDDTPSQLSAFRAANFRLSIFTQEKNLGMDGNMAFLYKKAASPYVWYFSDDDIPAEGCFDRVLGVLADEKPSVLLFDFEQPPGSRIKRFPALRSITSYEKPLEIIDAVTQWPKISIYVLKRLELPHSEWSYIESFIGTAYWFLFLTFSLVQQDKTPKVTVIPEFLASSDKDFGLLCFPPEVWRNSYIFYTHRYVMLHCPARWKRQKIRSYVQYINFLYGVASGNLKAMEQEKYSRAGKEISISLSLLKESPKSALKALILRTGLLSLVKASASKEGLP